ncbi:hypothetical protein GCM10028778_26810 [Barrientosiimonas marina]|uniref:TolB family protein n=1 Tax=Lentibacillus kimchii TaxID=1542911 RepID=A0ABW2UVW0_9BACI
MTVKMKNISVIAGLAVLFLVLWGAGSLAGPPKGFSGFGKTTDVSPDDHELVFSYYHDDDAALYTVPVSGGEAERLAKPDEGKSYVHPTFSPDGEKLVFMEQWEEETEGEKRRYSQLRIMARHDDSVKTLMNTSDYITEAAFSPDGESLYYLKADTYQNYSPVASEQPHDCDVFRLDLASGETEQITEKESYDMSSLNVSPDGDRLMYTTFNNGDQLHVRDLKTGQEETLVPAADFASNQTVISAPAFSSDGDHAVFSSVAAKDKQGTYIYEGFRMNLETEEAEQLTNFHEHVTSPVSFHQADKWLVTVDNNFARADSDYNYWKISADGDEREPVTINMPDT